MRSPADRRVPVTVVGVVMAALSVAAASVQPESARPTVTAERPGPAEITRALETVKADPNLSPERTLRTLQWNDSSERKSSGTPAWLLWIGGLFRWLEQSARLLVWTAAVVLAALLAVYITRTARRFRLPRGEDTFVAPTHVRDLDIRPESLPDDIGSAARLLWDRGDQRAALALLYRDAKAGNRTTSARETESRVVDRPASRSPGARPSSGRWVCSRRALTSPARNGAVRWIGVLNDAVRPDVRLGLRGGSSSRCQASTRGGGPSRKSATWPTALAEAVTSAVKVVPEQRGRA